MAQFFRIFLTGFLLLTVSHSVSAMGINDFVAVVDSPTAAVYNPAGLANLEERQLLLEHRVSERDLAVGWDDLAIYSASDALGSGALYLGYGRDWLGSSDYRRIQAIGYSYGWRPTERLALGVGAKYSKRDIYNNSSGVMVKQAALSNEFLIDFGLLYYPVEKWTIGFAFRNIGHDDEVQLDNSQSTIGAAYSNQKFTAAVEIYDLLNEGSSTLEGSLIRAGLRYNITSNIQIHGAIENSTSDWDYTGNILAVQFKLQSLNIDIAWYQAEGRYIYDDTVQAGMGFTF